MLKIKINSQEEFNKQMQEAEKQNIEVIHKNIKKYEFPCELVFEQRWENKKLIKLYLFNKADNLKEKINVNDLLYKTVEYVEETNNTYHIGIAYIKGIRYKYDNQSNEIDYFRADCKPYDLTGDEWLNRVDTVTCGWNNNIYPKDIIKIITN